MLKPNEKFLRYKEIINYFKKHVATDKKYILRKMSLKFKTLNPTSHAKQRFIYYYKLLLFGDKRSIRYNHNCLNKIVCFNFLKN